MLSESEQLEAEQLILRFVDDRDSLSDDELGALVAAVRDSEELAATLQQALVMDEHLSQALAIDRRDFAAQVAQRIRDHERGEEELSRQIDDVRRLAAADLSDKEARQRRRLVGLWTTSAALLIAAGVVAVWLAGAGESVVALFQDGDNEPRQVQDGDVVADARPAEVIGGERVVASSGQSLHVRYSDGTLVTVEADSHVRVGDEARNPGKRVYLEQGGLLAVVAAQAPRQPMIFVTDHAEVKVLGTQLWLSGGRADTRVEVISGRVKLIDKDDRSSLLLSAGDAGVAGRNGLREERVHWPHDRRGLAFKFHTSRHANYLQRGPEQQLVRCRVMPRGDARVDSEGRLELRGGTFVAPQGAAALAAACRRSSQLTIEAIIEAQRLDQEGPARIVAFAKDRDEGNFFLGQEGDDLVLGLRTTASPTGAADVQLAKLPDTQPHHFVATYRPGRLECFLDGTPMFSTSSEEGKLSNWDDPPYLFFGDDANGGRSWHGRLHGIAIYHRALDADEVLANYNALNRTNK